MTTTRNATFRIHALPAAVLATARTSGTDVVNVTAEGSEPLRCCLRNARTGESCLLFNHEPELPVGTPYRETGAVFAHAEPCGGPAIVTEYPADWVGRPQVLRAYDERGWIHPATRVHDGTDASAVISDLLADPAVMQLHSRNIAYGCYMFTVTR